MSRYIPESKEKWHFVPTIADKSTPTVAEITAGEDITGAIVTVSGFTYSGSAVQAPDLVSRFTPTVPGRVTADDSSIECYKGDEAADIEQVVRALLPKDADGFIVRVHPVDGAPAAIAAATEVEVWPIEVMANNVNNPATGELVKWTASFSHPSEPVLDAVIAA